MLNFWLALYKQNNQMYFIYSFYILGHSVMSQNTGQTNKSNCIELHKCGKKQWSSLGMSALYYIHRELTKLTKSCPSMHWAHYKIWAGFSWVILFFQSPGQEFGRNIHYLGYYRQYYLKGHQMTLLWLMLSFYSWKRECFVHRDMVSQLQPISKMNTN